MSATTLAAKNAWTAQRAVAVRGLSTGRVILAMIITAVMLVIPWTEIWQAQVGTPMEDRRVYEGQIINGYLGYDVRSFDDPISYIAHEYLWGWLLNLLARTIGLPIDVTFGIISAFVIFVACLMVLRHASAGYALLLFNPSFIDLAFSQMRMATAMGLMCAAYLVRGPRRLVLPLRAALVIASCFIHTSMAVFLLLFLGALIASRKPELSRPIYRYALLVAGGFAVALLLGPLRGDILADIGDRRVTAEYISYGPRFYVYWIVLAIVMTLTWKLVTISPVTAYALAALFGILFGLALGVYVNRIVAVSLPFLIAAIHAVPKSWRGFLVIAYVVYAAIYWLYWLNIL